MNADSSHEMFQVRVDPERCIGSGTCEMLEEETFVIGDDSVVASVVGRGLLPPERAAVVAERCPGNAILVEPAPTDPATPATDTPSAAS